jgi:dolichyl-phosphate-mannose-protein mannosyltransferase
MHLFLWYLLLTEPIFGKHFFARVVSLIFVPILVYMLFFNVHFALLYKSSTAGSFMSPEFQSTFKGNEIEDTFKEIAYGSKIIIRHEGTSGGYLHSHAHLYPAGSKQQQITCYPFRGL